MGDSPILYRVLFIDSETRLDDSGSVHLKKNGAGHFDLDPGLSNALKKNLFCALNHWGLSIAIIPTYGTMFQKSDFAVGQSFIFKVKLKISIYICDAQM